MRLTPRNAALIAMAATAFAPASAGAVLPGNCGKDYSKNAATGDYCAPVSESSSSTLVPPPAPASSSSSSDDFAWGDAALGAGGALLVVALAGGAMTVTRRRSPATS
jgi:hypothetical protein